jgi:hypothetical protein
MRLKMSRISLLLIVIGGVLGFIGFREWKLQASATAEPEKMSLESLIQRGSEGNPHVEITDYYFPGNYVVSTKNNAWDHVYFPVEPLNGPKLAGQFLANFFGADAPRISEAKAILIINKVYDQNALETFIRGHETVKGMVINGVRSLETKAQDLLRQNFPQTHFEKVVMLEVDRAPWDATQLMLMLGGAVVLVILGIGMTLWRWLASREQPYRGPATFSPPGTSGPEPA